MLGKNSAVEFAQQHAVGSGISIYDLQFALQLATVALGIEPEKMEWGVPFAQLAPRLPWILRVFSSHPAPSPLDSLISLWRTDSRSRDLHGGQLTLVDLLGIIARWRSAIGLGERPWFEADHADLLRIATSNEDGSEVRQPSGDEIGLVGRCGGVNVAEWQQGLYRQESTVLFSVRLLALSAREWIGPEEFRARFYPGSKLDPVVFVVLSDELPAPWYEQRIWGLLRPQDHVASCPDDVEDILVSVWTKLARHTEYDIPRDHRWPEVLGRDEPLLGYRSLHLLIAFLEENIVSRI